MRATRYACGSLLCFFFLRDRSHLFFFIFSLNQGGFALGVTLGTFVLKVRICLFLSRGRAAISLHLSRCQNLKELWYEKYVRFTGLAIAIIGAVFAVFWNIFHDFKDSSCP